MTTAIGFAIIIIAFGVFMPDVLRALSTFLLVLFQRATTFVQSMPMPVASPAANQ